MVTRTFYGRIEDGQIHLDVPTAYRAYLRELGQSPERAIVLTVGPMEPKRSIRQNRAFHAMITSWARERGWTVDELKTAILGLVFGTVEQTQPLTGMVVTVPAEPRSSQLSVAQFQHLIDETLRIAAEDGYPLQAPDEYRCLSVAATGSTS